MKGSVEETSTHDGTAMDMDKSTTIRTIDTADHSPSVTSGQRGRAIVLQRSRSLRVERGEFSGASSPDDRRRFSVKSDRSGEHSDRHVTIPSRTADVETISPSPSQRHWRHRPSVHSIHSVHSGRSGPRKSITSLDLAALENLSRTCHQIDAKDLVASGDQSDCSPAVGIDKIIDEERKRLSSKFTSQAFENNMRGMMAEKKLMRSTSSLGKGSPAPRGPKVVRKPFHDEGDDEGAATQEMLALNEKMLKYVGKVTPLKWLMTVVIAILIALQAGGIIFGTIKIVEVKVDVMAHLSRDGATGQFYAFLALLAYAAVACFIGSYLAVYHAPHAAGSGIPEIKAFLNGIHMPKAFTPMAWACRAIGLMLVTSAGMFAGTEGPFAHLGGITAKIFGADGPFGSSYWPAVLQGHRNRCEFISQGAAMGVAAAFGAPIGGILFSLEEASSFWTKAMTWRSFLGTVIAALLAKLVKVGFTSLVVEGFISFPDKDASFELWELLTFAPLALVSGLLGALFCNMVKWLLLFRRRYFKLGAPTRGTKLRRMLEVQLIVVFTLVVCFWPAVLIGCRELPHAEGAEHRRLGGAHSDGPPDLAGGLCPQVDGKDTYSDLAYILLSPKEKAIRTLFSLEMADGAYLSVPALLLGWAVSFFTTILTFGAAIPVGLFIPNILAGACLGRAFGQALLEWEFKVHPGVYALMGSAGALGGFSRMTISLAVIFLEITNNMNLLMPLMLVIMISKNVADQFGPSVYDTVLETNPDIHLLEDNLSEDHLISLQGLKVREVCTRDIVVVHTQESIDDIMVLLQRCKFGGFPVVDDAGVIVGIIARAHLVSILGENDDGSEVVNLMRYANTAPDITVWNTSVVHAFQHFRACGLQHLNIVDHEHHIVGIMTRTDFARLCEHGVDVEELRSFINRNDAVDLAEEPAHGPPASDWMESSQVGDHEHDQAQASSPGEKDEDLASSPDGNPSDGRMDSGADFITL